MDLHMLAPLAGIVPLVKKLFPNPVPRQVWDGINKGGQIILLGGVAAIRVEEMNTGEVISLVKLENKLLLLTLKYSWASKEAGIIRETFIAILRSSGEIFTFIFEHDEVKEMWVGEEVCSGFWTEFYAEQIRRAVYGVENADMLLPLGSTTPKGWRSK